MKTLDNMNLPTTCEPLLIELFKGENSDWVHPDIETLIEQNLTSEDLGTDIPMYTGPLWRMWLENADGDTVGTTVVVFNKEFSDTIYESVDEGELLPTTIWNDEAVGTARGCVTILLTEDVWCPEGEQFYFSEFGQKVKDLHVAGISPDVCVHTHEGKWTYST